MTGNDIVIINIQTEQRPIGVLLFLHHLYCSTQCYTKSKLAKLRKTDIVQEVNAIAI